MSGYCRNTLTIVWDPFLGSLTLPPQPHLLCVIIVCFLWHPSLASTLSLLRNYSRSVIELEIFAICLPVLRQIWGLSFHGIKDCNPDKLILENRTDSIDNQTVKHQELVKSWKCDEFPSLFFYYFYIRRHNSYKTNDFREIRMPRTRWILWNKLIRYLGTIQNTGD